jgi:hypothetical protein
MYQIGLPAKTKRPKKLYIIETLAIFILVAGLVSGVYWFAVGKTGSAAVLVNDTKPRITQVKASDKTTNVDEATFTLELPGTWKEADRDVDVRYHSITWTNISRGGVGRWLRVYIDTIPADYAANFLMPVAANGNEISAGQKSDNCVTFTPGANKDTARDRATGPTSLPSSWQGVNFICDNSHVTHQLVVAGSKGQINAVTVTGPTKGAHKYFFVYNDDAYTPDYNVFADAVSGFKAK